MHVPRYFGPLIPGRPSCDDIKIMGTLCSLLLSSLFLSQTFSVSTFPVTYGLCAYYFMDCGAGVLLCYINGPWAAPIHDAHEKPDRIAPIKPNGISMLVIIEGHWRIQVPMPSDVLLTFPEGASPLGDTAPFCAIGNNPSPYVCSSEENAQQRPHLARVMHIQRMDGNSCGGGLPHLDPRHGQGVVLRTQSVQALTCCGIKRRWHVLGDYLTLQSRKIRVELFSCQVFKACINGHCVCKIWSQTFVIIMREGHNMGTYLPCIS